MSWSNSTFIEKMKEMSIDKSVYSLLSMMEKRKLYEEKYIDKGTDSGVLVAPQTPGSEVLRVLGIEKQGEIYPELKDKQVTDIWGGLSSLAFELSPSVKGIIVVDPIFHYDDIKERMEAQRQKAERRFNDKNPQVPKEKLLEVLRVEREVCEGIEKRQKNSEYPNPKIVTNDSLAQHIEWIPADSQDAVFINFVLDKLKGNTLTGEIILALENAYRITKPWGKIYCIHDKMSHEDEIIDGINATWYPLLLDKYIGRYIVFIIEKK